MKKDKIHGCDRCYSMTPLLRRKGRYTLVCKKCKKELEHRKLNYVDRLEEKLNKCLDNNKEYKGDAITDLWLCICDLNARLKIKEGRKR